jgi:hypothetical protein
MQTTKNVLINDATKQKYETSIAEVELKILAMPIRKG